MKLFSKGLGLAAVAVAATLTLSACSGSSEESAVPETSTEVEIVEEVEVIEGDATPEPTMAPEVEIDPEIAELLNPGEGQAIVPNSIPTETQENLTPACEEAVAPIREIMAGVSGLAASPEQLAEVGELRAGAEADCEPQEYADWYTKEFAGWLYQE